MSQKTYNQYGVSHPQPGVTMSLCVHERGDQSGRWLYSSAKSVEGAVRTAIDRCTDKGYAIGESLVTVWEGEHATPVNAIKLGEYNVVTKHGVILSINAVNGKVKH